MADSPEQDRFRREVLPHVDAAYNLARWMLGNESDAHDVAQDALLRALRSLHQLRGGNVRPWLLTIVRNCACTHLSSRKSRKHAEFDEAMHRSTAEATSDDPSVIVANQLDSAAVKAAIQMLPVEFREVIVLRELEQMDYRKIAIVMGVPIGTVMSRLARGRARLREALSFDEEGI